MKRPRLLDIRVAVVALAVAILILFQVCPMAAAMISEYSRKGRAVEAAPADSISAPDMVSAQVLSEPGERI